MKEHFSPDLMHVNPFPSSIFGGDEIHQYRGVESTPFLQTERRNACFASNIGPHRSLYGVASDGYGHLNTKQMEAR